MPPAFSRERIIIERLLRLRYGEDGSYPQGALSELARDLGISFSVVRVAAVGQGLRMRHKARSGGEVIG